MMFRRMTMYLNLVLILAGLAACPGRSSDQPPISDLKGEYRIVSGERNGAPIDQDEFHNATIHIDDHTITAYDKDRNETLVATYTLVTNRVPWKITMISIKAPEPRAVTTGLIEASPNGVKLIYALPNGRPPTDFTAGEHQQMFVMTKVG